MIVALDDGLCIWYSDEGLYQTQWYTGQGAVYQLRVIASQLPLQ